jgi:agmatine deiminase
MTGIPQKKFGTSDRGISFVPEWSRHASCWMAWTFPRYWRRTETEVKRQLRTVIKTISEFEQVRLLVPHELLGDAERQNFGPNVEIVEAMPTDLWMRDIGPTFAFRDQQLVAVDWNFRDWDGPRTKSEAKITRLTELIAVLSGAERLIAPFVAEGGAILVHEKGTILTTKSCLLQRNRNVSEHRLGFEFRRLGAASVIWLEGDGDEPITTGHIDGYVALASEKQVLVEISDPLDPGAPRHREDDIATLRSQLGHHVEIVAMLPPRRSLLKEQSATFAPCYLNAYLANGAVITGKFGDPERDELAYAALCNAFPGRQIVMLNIDAISARGGGVRCLTQPVPAFPGLV